MIEDTDDDLPFGDYQGSCEACDTFGWLDDTGLCESCAGKFERDLIRIRAWGHSAMAFGRPADKREELREHIIAEYGERLELLAEEERQKWATKGEEGEH